MRISWIALFGSLVGAQTFSGLPSCATSCLTAFESGSTIAGCNSLDISCICSNQSFLGSIACCLAAQCSAADQQAATQYALNLCKANAVTNLPTAVSCSSTATSTTQVATGTSSSNGLAVSTTSSATTHTSSSSASSTSAAAAITQTNNASPQRIPGIGGAGVVGGLAVVAAFL